MSEKEKKSNSIFKSPFWDRFTFVSFVLVLVCGICLAVTIFFQKRYFGYFFVNGQSMYPTLNLNAADRNGRLYKETGGSVSEGAQHIDYGFYDYHESALNDLHRYDIVICKYFDGDTSEKIKRIIVMPGETFYFDISTENNGALYIMNSDGTFDYVEQPVDVSKGLYGKYKEPHTLENDEYFVMGDNRAHSSDSRDHGPVKKHNIEGKVIGLVAECRIGFSGTSYYPVDIQYYSPRFF